MKHYHGTPLGGTRDGVARFFAGRFAFVPFMRPEDLACVADVATGMAFDNSAFSFWRKQLAIMDWGKYFRMVDEWKYHPRFEFAIIPDVVDGTEADNRELLGTWHKRMGPSDRGVPVWHLHESLSYLQYLIDHYPMIAFGSSGQWKTPGTEAWFTRMDAAMSVLCDDYGRPKSRAHGLRMLRSDIVRRYPFYSCDSTSVAQNMGLTRRFGTYPASTTWQRAEQIARTIEAVVSPAVWVRTEEQYVLDY